jgi:hypothetical protein
MHTKLARKYGLGKSIDACTDLADKQELCLSAAIINRAHEMYAVINSPSFVLGATSSMIACVTLFLTAKSTG